MGVVFLTKQPLSLIIEDENVVFGKVSRLLPGRARSEIFAQRVGVRFQNSL
jgi:hypothetical protein